MDARLAICLLTYKRTEYATRALKSTLRNLRREGVDVHVHIADDGSIESHVNHLVGIAEEFGFTRDSNLTTSNAERGGYGKNVNLAMQVLHNISDYILMLEDDWELVDELCIDEYIRDMESTNLVGCVRMGYLSFTQPLRGQVLKLNDRGYLLLDPGSPEPHVFAGHPRLEKVSYQRGVGAWPEGLTPGETEFVVAHKLAARQGVAWPMDTIYTRGDLFAHIGTVRSY